jgi:tetratricopeptide (TPR) repeat protein/transcriptional regulator with XRE-family HTH domain
MQEHPMPHPNRKLRDERLRRQWTQQNLADHLETTKLTIGRWERGTSIPGPHFRLKLCALFGKNADALGLLPVLTKPDEGPSDQQHVSAQDSLAPSLLWNLPYPRNPFFTGRDGVLIYLHTVLHSQNALTQGYALSGLGGIGKTQTALEYAYRFRTDYQAVLWVRAETREILLSDMAAIAKTVGVAGKDERDQNGIVQTVRQWLTHHTHWLLILDNVEDFALVEEVCPSEIKGHLLFTTRAQATGLIAQRIDLRQMEPEEGALFLLRRSKHIALSASLDQILSEAHAVARTISCTLDGLPLALDQAGAYIEETGCGLSDYLDRYQTSRTLLLKRRGGARSTHPSCVLTTFSLSFERLEQRHPAAADILRLCAFLHPNAIPEEFLTEPRDETTGLAYLSETPSHVALDDAIVALRHFSLLHRNSDTRTLTMHRLVQAVLRDQMDEQAQQAWAERALGIVSKMFPNVELLLTWSQCQRYLPHAHVCIEHIDQWHLTSPEAVRLLMQTSAYLREQAQEAQANILAERVAAIRQHSLEPSTSDMIMDFFSFMRHAYYQGKYHEAGELIREKVARLEQTLDSDHPDRIYLLIGQAFFSQIEGKYTQAEALYQQALTMENVSFLYQRLAISEEERVEGVGLPHIGFVFSLLGQLYTALGNYQQAETFFEQSGAIWDQYATLTPHIFKGPYLHGFALLALIKNQYEKARDLLRQEQALLVEILGENHPIRADNNNALAHLALSEGEYATAEVLLRHAKGIFEQTTGLNHPFAARTFHIWAKLSLLQDDIGQAERHCQKAIQISEQICGENHPETATIMKTLADIYRIQRRWAEAEFLYQRVLTIFEEAWGTIHPENATTLESYAELLQMRDREIEAGSTHPY